MEKSKVTVIPSTSYKNIEKQNVAAYARVSTAKDTQLQSLGAQISYYKDKIKSNPAWNFAGVFVDEGMTGTKMNRPGMLNLLNKCREHKIDLILTKSISRFARNTIDLLNTIRELKNLDVAVFFERENINTLHAEGEFMLTLLASFAEEESRSMSMNKNWANKKQFEEGVLVGLTHLYGYDIINNQPVINEKEAEIVRMIYNDYLSGMQSKDIAHKLNQMGVLRKRGGRWKPSDISQLLNNEKHTGNALLNKRYVIDPITKETTYNKGEKAFYLVENSHEAIVSKELFDAVQEEMKRRTSHKKTTKKHNKPFTTLMKCGACGANFNRKKTPVRVFWRCARNLGMRDGHCSMKGIPEETLEDLCVEVLQLTQFDPDEAKEQIQEIVIPGANEVLFRLKDGTTVLKTWQDRSRSESWTPEMRAEVGRRNRERSLK